MKPRTAEEVRLEEDRLRKAAWKRWGPYVSDRSWGTVREDYSPDGYAWEHFPHDHARSKAYRWGEDGIAGFCDRYQLLVFALALWNGRDPILKERLFGLTPGETNHGEDVKEYYFHLDATPTHSYMKYLYKYPQAEYPYGRLIEESRGRGGAESEYELLDTGVFDEGRYFDVFVEYAKAGPEDLCIRIEVCNRGPEEAPIHVLPHLWFRNTWSWGPRPLPAPVIRAGAPSRAASSSSPTTPGPSRCGTCCAPMRWASAAFTPTPAGACCSRTTRPTANACTALRPRAGVLMSRTPSTATSSTARTASTPPRRGPRPAFITPTSWFRPAARRSSACG